ncbi:MAG TPA: hypothetical protein PLV95_01435 [Candidatus Pacearchaeota archaeon]|nr:hypothetical protein [Candidatus Pacearchaeota archaeon]
MIPEPLFLVRKLLFSFALGFSVYFVLLFSKPIIEESFKKKYNDDAYFWTIIFMGVVTCLISIFFI